MKQWITLVAATAIFASCTKENLQEESLQHEVQQEKLQTSALRMVEAGAYVSDWEQYKEWPRTNEGGTSMFIVKRKTPEVNSDVINGGLVLSYAKTMTTNPNYALFTSPVMMPFYYLPEAERPYPPHYYFSNTNSEGDVTIVYKTPVTKEDLPTMGGEASLQTMQFRHIVMTRAFLEANGLTSQTVQNNYTYEQVVNLLNR